MRVAVGCALALVLAGCVGDKVQLGGVDARTPLPAATRACDLRDLTLVERGRFNYPDEVKLFYYATQKKGVRHDRMVMRFDINAEGRAVNVSYVGPPEDTRHSTKQMLIRTAADALLDSRWEWIGPPTFGIGCEQQVEFILRDD